MLECKNVSYHSLVKNITLKFKPGNLYGILGPNGSGKSTFFKTISKIWEPTSGKILWNGKDLHLNERRKISQTISLVPQDIQIHFDFSAQEIVEMGRYPHQKLINTSQMMETFLKMVDAWHLKNRYISHLSIGERQRIYIARALMTESPILLLDEPSSSLDIRHQIQIWQLLQSLSNKGKIVIVATHDILGVKRFCDQVAIFNAGNCLAKGKTKQILTNRLLSDVFGVIESDREFILTKVHFPHFT